MPILAFVGGVVAFLVIVIVAVTVRKNIKRKKEMAKLNERLKQGGSATPNTGGSPPVNAIPMQSFPSTTSNPSSPPGQTYSAENRVLHSSPSPYSPTFSNSNNAISASEVSTWNQPSVQGTSNVNRLPPPPPPHRGY